MRAVAARALAGALLQLVLGASAQYIPQALIKNPPLEGTTIKTWAFLKESMGHLGDQVMQLLLVRKDIGAMQQDLKTQVLAWHHAELQLAQDNEQLASQEKSLENDVRAGDSVRFEVTKREQALEDEKQKGTIATAQSEEQQKQWAAEKQALLERRSSIEERFKVLNHTARMALESDTRTQLDLSNDAHTLKLAISGQEARVKDGFAQLHMDVEKARSDSYDLERQLSDMKAGIAQLQKASASFKQEALEAEIAQLKDTLKVKTAELVKITQESNEESSKCQAHKDVITQVLDAEKGKAVSRQQEAVEFCQPVRGRHDVLEQEVAACTTKAL